MIRPWSLMRSPVPTACGRAVCLQKGAWKRPHGNGFLAFKPKNRTRRLVSTTPVAFSIIPGDLAAREDSAGVLARGLGSMWQGIQSWSLGDLTLGLALLAKVTESQLPEVPGAPAKEMHDVSFLKQAQRFRAHAEAMYAANGAEWSLQTHMPASAILKARWEPDIKSFCPAYVICEDSVEQCLVVAVRGTADVVEVLVDAGIHPVEWDGGFVHSGFLHAAQSLNKEIEEIICLAVKTRPKLPMVFVGHSLGAAVSILSAMEISRDLPDLKGRVKCWGFGPPACLSSELLEKSREIAVCMLGYLDIVPRFSSSSVEDLRKDVENLQLSEAEVVLKDDEDFKKLRMAKSILTKVELVTTDAVGKLQAVHSSVSELSASILPGSAHESNAGEMMVKNADAPPWEGKRMYPPGRLLVLACNPPSLAADAIAKSEPNQQERYDISSNHDDLRRSVWSLSQVEATELSRVIVTQWGIAQHMTSFICEGIHALLHAKMVGKES